MYLIQTVQSTAYTSLPAYDRIYGRLRRRYRPLPSRNWFFCFFSGGFHLRRDLIATSGGSENLRWIPIPIVEEMVGPLCVRREADRDISYAVVRLGCFVYHLCEGIYVVGPLREVGVLTLFLIDTFASVVFFTAIQPCTI